MKYILIDTSNAFWRSRHMASKNADAWTKVGYALHLTLSIINKAMNDFNGDHVVFCLERKSWRKDFYEPYKKNRTNDNPSAEDVETDKLFYDAYTDFCEFLSKRTKCTVLQVELAEADDLIARWIATHPDDDHVIISGDSDFHQLIAPNVTQYNGVANEYVTLNGVFDDKGKPVKDNKTSQQKTIGDPRYVLFEKCIRGDSSDNIFSAYPGVRKKGSKNRIGILEAFDDIDKKGYNWNNMMLQKWTDHNGDEHRVLDDYERNKQLIDLNSQPDELKAFFDEQISIQSAPKDVKNIGVYLLKFCGKYDLVRIAENASNYSEWMKK